MTLKPPTPPRLLLLSFLFVQLGCAAGPRGKPAPLPFDVVVIPGCPGEADGALSPCQARRAVWAAVLWERGLASHFITSGAAVHSPYVEAEGLAAAIAALGVPADRVYLEPDALHTDENMYDSLRIARALGFRRLAVASEGMQAGGGCSMMRDYGQECTGLSMEHRLVARRRDAAAGLLGKVRAPRVPANEWLTRDERERRSAERTGRRRRPPSFVLYAFMGVMRLFGLAVDPLRPGAGAHLDLGHPLRRAGRRALADGGAIA